LISNFSKRRESTALGQNQPNLMFFDVLIAKQNLQRATISQICILKFDAE